MLTAGQLRNREAWARRHPERAAQERAFRKERIAAEKDFGHKSVGTIETHAHAAQVRQGAIARLYISGRLSIAQMAWAQEIRAVVERIGREVATRTASLETRVDTSRHGDAFWEALGAVRAEVAYSRWRRELGAWAPLVLDIIVEDIALTQAAARHRLSVRRAGRMLDMALDYWGSLIRDACRDIDETDLLLAHIRLA